MPHTVKIWNYLVQWYANNKKLKFLDLAPKLAPEAKSSSLREAGTRLAFSVTVLTIFWLFLVLNSGNATSAATGTRASDVTNRLRSSVARVLVRILLPDRTLAFLVGERVRYRIRNFHSIAKPLSLLSDVIYKSTATFCKDQMKRDFESAFCTPLIKC